MTFSENVARLQPSATMAVSSLAKRLRAEGRDIIDLSAGEPDFDTPSWLVDAAVEGVRAGATRYTPAAGMPELRAAIAQSLVARGADAAWSDIVVTAGAKQALFNACFTFFGPGDEVMIASPYWTSYPEMVTLSRAEPVFVQGPPETNFLLRPEDLEAARTERTRGLIMCSPSNPTGAGYTREELALAGFDKQYAAAVCDTCPVLILTHMPLSRVPADTVNLHGHIHAAPGPTRHHRNLSVERTGYQPVRLSEVLASLNDVDLDALDVDLPRGFGRD